MDRSQYNLINYHFETHTNSANFHQYYNNSDINKAPLILGQDAEFQKS